MINKVRAFQAAAAATGIAALILGLVLAGGEGGASPVIALGTMTGTSPDQVKAMVSSSEAHQAGMLVIDAATQRQAAAALQVLSALKSPLDVSVQVAPSGAAGIAGEFPAAARVIDANGNLLRSGTVAGGPGLLVLLWAALLLAFAYLAFRVAADLGLLGRRVAPDLTGGQGTVPHPPVGRLGVDAPDGQPAVLHPLGDGGTVLDPPGGQRGGDPPGDRPTVPETRPAPSTAAGILAGYLPGDPRARWEPQCPRCGSFSVAAAGPGAADGCQCRSCEYRWPAADPTEWPDVVVSERRRLTEGPALPREN
jgi:hypothetical protein